jgi:hypothetical protein
MIGQIRIKELCDVLWFQSGYLQVKQFRIYLK